MNTQPAGGDVSEPRTGGASEEKGVPFLDGPMAGKHMPPREAVPASLLVDGDPVPVGKVARYRYSPKKHGYVFKGLDQVVLRVPVGKGV
jgi:hypothetical protein